MTEIRKFYKKDSNNPDDPNRNLCAEAVARVLFADRVVRYLHTISDLVRAARTVGWTVRSRKSSVRGKTVGAIRSQLPKLGATYYIVRVDGHVLLLDKDGKTIVDTAPRKKDKRRITHLYGVFAPENPVLRGLLLGGYARKS